MTIMITGGAGFLGSYLARYLVTEQQQKGVVIFDRNPIPDRFAGIEDRVTVVQGDAQEPTDVLAAMRAHDVDRVIHMAFIAGTEEPGRALPYLRFQCMATATVYDCARLHGIRRVVNASSHAVYGEGHGGRPAAEDDPLRPGPVLYGACKVWTEHVAENYNSRYGMEIISLRLQSAYGVGRIDRARSWSAGLLNTSGWKQPNYRANIELAAMGQPITMPPDDLIDDFIHAEDTAQACWLAAMAPKPKHSAFNVSNEHRPAGDYTRIVRELLPRAEVTVTARSRTPVLLSNTRIREELGFAPRFSLEAGLPKYLQEITGNAPEKVTRLHGARL